MLCGILTPRDDRGIKMILHSPYVNLTVFPLTNVKWHWFWPLINSDFPTDQTFNQFHDLYTELDLRRIMSGFHGAFATGVAGQKGTLTLPDIWFRPPFWDSLVLQLLRPDSSNLPCLYSTFRLEYPLVFSRFCFYILVTWWKRLSMNLINFKLRRYDTFIFQIY